MEYFRIYATLYASFARARGSLPWLSSRSRWASGRTRQFSAWLIACFFARFPCTGPLSSRLWPFLPRPATLIPHFPLLNSTKSVSRPIKSFREWQA